MARNRFAEDGTVRLSLSDGDWIDIRRELDYGRQQRMAMAGLRSVKTSALETPEDSEIGIDWQGFGFARIEAWLVDWSFRDSDGRPRQCTRTNIERLHPDTAAEILASLDDYQSRLDAERSHPNGSVPSTPA